MIGGSSEVGSLTPPETTALHNWQTSPHLHWSFQHIADLLPVATISRGQGPVVPLAAGAGVGDLRGVTLVNTLGTPTTVGQVINSTNTDGWIVSHRGRIVAEDYLDGMTPATRHLLMSVSKSLVGTVAGALCDSGVLHADAPITSYLPDLHGSGYDGATVRHLLDMRSGIRFSENYLDPMAEVRLLDEAIDWAPRTGNTPARTLYGFLAGLGRQGSHGGPFEYRSCETDMLGWVCEAAAGMRMPQLMSQVLWSRIGAEHDATIGIDSVGTGMFDGGINAALRDLVRFGSVYLSGGISLTGERIVSADWVDSTMLGGHDSRDAFAQSPDDTRMPGGMYRNQFWFPYHGNDVVLCLGIHGQMIYLNRSAGVVAAKLSCWPYPQDAHKLFTTVRAFDAVSAALG